MSAEVAQEAEVCDVTDVDFPVLSFSDSDSVTWRIANNLIYIW